MLSEANGGRVSDAEVQCGHVDGKSRTSHASYLRYFVNVSSVAEPANPQNLHNITVAADDFIVVLLLHVP